MFSRFLAAVVAVLIWVAPQAAQARWLRAETQRFVVYSDGDEAELRAFTAKLATFDQVLRLMHGVKDRELDRKLDVYLITGIADFRRVMRTERSGVLGFYQASPQTVFALALAWRDGEGFGSQDVLFHEYTHHFMLEYFPAAYPSWLIEGYAEYFGPTEVKPDAIELGRYNPLRAGSLLTDNWLSLHDLLTLPPSKVPNARRNVYYSQSWLLTHYMLTDETRARQLDVANRAAAAGRPADKALEEATGQTEEQLNHALHDYARSKLLYRRLRNPFAAAAPQIAITTLPESADAILPERLSLAVGLKAEPARDLLSDIRNRARRYPGDAFAELTLAQAEILYGDRTAAQNLLQRRLAANPKEAESLRLMGESYLATAGKDAEHRAELLKTARPYLSRAYAVDSDDYRTLYDYALARAADADYPNDNTLNVLMLAVQLAPSVEEVRFKAGEALLARGQTEQAVAMLTPVANSPHGELQNKAADLIAKARGDPPPASSKVAAER